MIEEHVRQMVHSFKDGKLLDYALEAAYLGSEFVQEYFWTLIWLSVLTFVVSLLSRRYQNKRIKFYFKPES
jgi:hypothetical protein